MTESRPSGVSPVTTQLGLPPVGAVIVLVNVPVRSPSKVQVSVIDTTLSGSLDVVSSTSRFPISLRSRPPGVRTTSDASIGASTPHLGSPASVNVVTVPSGSVPVMRPSSPAASVVTAPLGVWTVRLYPPVGSCSNV
jgi:hypothetical protein